MNSDSIYECLKCSKRFEKPKKYKKTPLIEYCPHCKSTLTRQTARKAGEILEVIPEVQED